MVTSITIKKLSLGIIVSLIPFLFVQFSLGYCGVNSQGNKYCSYGEDCYEYWNLDGSHYYKCNGYSKYTPPPDTNREEDYSQKYYYCSANSYYKDGNCRCNEGFVLDASRTKCVKDWDYHCSKNYPGTVYRKSDKMCVCPGDNPMGRDESIQGCWKSCKEVYGEKALSLGGNLCSCIEGYEIDTARRTCVEKKTSEQQGLIDKENPEDKELDATGRGIWILIGSLGIFVLTNFGNIVELVSSLRSKDSVGSGFLKIFVGILIFLLLVWLESNILPNLSGRRNQSYSVILRRIFISRVTK